jgi:hypothetical protein
VGATHRSVAAVLLAITVGGCSSHHESTSAAKIPYLTDQEQLREPFPGDAIDTTGALFLAEGDPMPDPTAPGTGRPIIYSLSARRIKITYHPPTGGECSIDVTREFRTPEEERLIGIAEVTYPLRDAIALQQHIPLRKHLWTLAPEGEVGVAYALTMDALRHFLNVTRRCGEGMPPDGKPGPMKVCNLTYSARVTHQQSLKRDRTTYRDVSVVELRLEWSRVSHHGAQTSAEWITMDRTVLFDRAGHVVAVFGDRPARHAMT